MRRERQPGIKEQEDISIFSGRAALGRALFAEEVRDIGVMAAAEKAQGSKGGKEEEGDNMVCGYGDGDICPRGMGREEERGDGGRGLRLQEARQRDAGEQSKTGSSGLHELRHDEDGSLIDREELGEQIRRTPAGTHD